MFFSFCADANLENIQIVNQHLRLHSSLCTWHSVPVTNIAISHSKCNYSCNWGFEKKNRKEKLLEFVMKPQPNIFFYFSYIWLRLLRLCMRYPFEEENGICALLYTEKGRKKQTVIFGQYKNIHCERGNVH